MERNRDRVLHPLIPSSPQPRIPLRMDEITLSTVGSSPRKTGNKVLLAIVLGSHIHHCVQARPWGAQGFELLAGWGLRLLVFSSLLLLIRTTWRESLHLP